MALERTRDLDLGVLVVHLGLGNEFGVTNVPMAITAPHGVVDLGTIDVVIE